MYKFKFSKILIMVLSAINMTAVAWAMEKPVTLVDQGSFAAGGTVTKVMGNFDYSNPTNPAGQTLHGDHAYVFYQIPAQAHKYPLIFLHGSGQSKRTWETTPDGRDGFQNIFLGRNYSIYLVDQPRRGEAGRSTDGGSAVSVPDELLWFNNFRLGKNESFYKDVEFPQDKSSLEQFYRQMTPDTGRYDAEVISDAVAKVFERSGEGILVTHSQGGGIGWLAAVKTDKIKGIVAFEPGSGFVFPEKAMPEALETTSPFGALKGEKISDSDFEKLTRIPIVIYYGDNIPLEPTDDWNEDNWRVRLQMAKIWAKTVNEYGGDVTVIHLPSIGIKGNTHFMFADLNNVDIANLMESWLHEKSLDKY